MDNDDLYSKGALKAIQEAFQPQPYVIDIDYTQYDAVNDKSYTSGNKLKHEKYRVLNNGPFLSLCEPSRNIQTCYCRPHTYLSDGYPIDGNRKRIASTKIRKPLATMVVHSKNMMNKITGYKI